MPMEMGVSRQKEKEGKWREGSLEELLRTLFACYGMKDRADVTGQLADGRRSWSIRPFHRPPPTPTLPTHSIAASTMKISAVIALAAVGGASAYSVNRSTLRSLGQKSVAGNTARSHVRSNDIKMEGEECTTAMHYVVALVVVGVFEYQLHILLT